MLCSLVQIRLPIELDCLICGVNKPLRTRSAAWYMFHQLLSKLISELGFYGLHCQHPCPQTLEGGAQAWVTFHCILKSSISALGPSLALRITGVKLLVIAPKQRKSWKLKTCKASFCSADALGGHGRATWHVTVHLSSIAKRSHTQHCVFLAIHSITVVSHRIEANK
jgi:hypothetical protein